MLMPRSVELVFQGWEMVLMDDLSLSKWQPLIMDVLAARFAGNEESVAKVEREVSSLFSYWNVNGADRWDEVTVALNLDWCWKPRNLQGNRFGWVSQSTARNRQWIVLTVCKAAAEMGVPLDLQALIGERIERARNFTANRPLTDAEDRIVRKRVEAMSALAANRVGVLTAVSYAGGTPKEMSLLQVGDVDLDAKTISFGGRAARVNRLDDWSAAIIGRFLANRVGKALRDEDLLCVERGTAAAGAARSVSVRLYRLFKEIGLQGRPGVVAGSLRLTTARRILDADGIEGAAKFLGSRSLDRVAASLEHDWDSHNG